VRDRCRHEGGPGADGIEIEGISRSDVSRICAGLDAGVAAFRTRPLGETAFPYLWLDATYLKVREGGRVVSMAAIIATGVAMTGERRVLGLELSPGNDEGSAWPTFIRSLLERGLRGVRLVISDDHRGLVKAVGEQLPGAGWQRCRVHFTRNAQDLVPRS
jgi:putative transposase